MRNKFIKLIVVIMCCLIFVSCSNNTKVEKVVESHYIMFEGDYPYLKVSYKNTDTVNVKIYNKNDSVIYERKYDVDFSKHPNESIFYVDEAISVDDVARVIVE